MRLNPGYLLGFAALWLTVRWLFRMIRVDMYQKMFVDSRLFAIRIITCVRAYWNVDFLRSYLSWMHICAVEHLFITFWCVHYSKSAKKWWRDVKLHKYVFITNEFLRNLHSRGPSSLAYTHETVIRDEFLKIIYF